MAMPTLILASRSPRRRELLAKLGIPFTVQSADVDETPLKNEAPLAYVQRVAALKAQTIAAINPGCVVLAADTPVLVGRRILQTPTNVAEALAMLKLQSNRRVHVPTAVAVVDAQGKLRQALASSWWKVKPLTAADMHVYLESEQWRGVSGAIKSDKCEHWLIKFYGSASGSSGLPLYETARLLTLAGLQVASLLKDEAA
jgi:septum formation protein